MQVRKSHILKGLVAVAVCALVTAGSYVVFNSKPAPATPQETLSAAAGPLISIAFNPAGTKLAAGNTSGDVFLWVLASKKRTDLEPISSVPITSLTVTDDEFLIAGTEDGKAGGWDLISFEIQVLPELHTGVGSISVRPGHFEVLFGLRNEYLVLLDRKGLQEIKTGHKRGVQSTAYSPDGKTFVTGGGDGKLSWWDAEKREFIDSRTLHDTDISGLAFSEDGRWLASGDWNGKIIQWERSSKMEVKTFTQPDAISGLVFHGDQIITSSWDGKIRFLSIYEGRIIHEIDTGSVIHAMAVHPEGRVLATVTEDEIVRLWKLPCCRFFWLLLHILIVPIMPINGGTSGWTGLVASSKPDSSSQGSPFFAAKRRGMLVYF